MLYTSSPAELIDKIYEAGAVPTQWENAMAAISDAFNGVDAVLGGMTSGHIPLFVAPRTDPHMVRLYAEHYHAHNPLPLALQKQMHGRAVIDADLADLHQFHRTEFYNDWCLPQGHRAGVGMKIRTTGGWDATLMISSSRDIEAETLGTLELLAPHLTRALQINQVLRENHARTLSVFSALERTDRAVFLIASDQSCEPANDLAQAMVSAGDGLLLRNGRLSCRDPADTNALQRAIFQSSRGQQSGTGASLSITRAGPRLPLQILVLPLPAGGWTADGRRCETMLVVTDPELTIARKIGQLQDQYGLTPSEAEVLRELALGGDREEIAARLGISLATVRTQLTSIFDKSGLRRQTDILRLLMAPQ